MTTYISPPSSSSPLSSIQGTRAYGDGNPNTTTTITYNFAQKAGTYGWSNAYKADFRAALAVIESVANIKFVETFNSFSADLVEYIAPSSYFGSNSTLGHHVGPWLYPSEGAFNIDYWSATSGNGDPGGFFFTTILHELGHALGLGHPHDTSLNTTIMNGVTSPFYSYGTGDLNQGIFTVMSYNDGWTQRDGHLPINANSGGATGFGALDIAALQAMYGANTTTNSSNSVYSLAGSNSKGVGYQSIWDTGGVDTIQHTGSNNAVIDLRIATLDYSNSGGGRVSYVDGVKGGFTIANGVVIENASGGSGNDLITGNAAANVLRGNAGNDTIYSVSNGQNDNTIYGGDNNDVIHLAIGTGSDTVFGEGGNDTAYVIRNSGSFSGGSGWDTVNFSNALSGYLVSDLGSRFEIYDVAMGETFTIFDDVEHFGFSGGTSTKYTQSQLTSATAIVDIETTGTALRHAEQGVYVLGNPVSKIAVIYNNQSVGDSSFGNWQAIHAEAASGGYKILWEGANGAYTEWTVNAFGRYISHSRLSNFVDREVFYNADLNNDGTIGHLTQVVESVGSASLTGSTHGYYEINNSVRVKLNNAEVGPESIPGWDAIHAEASGGDYRVLWKNASGEFSDWTLDSNGNYITHTRLTDVRDVEAFYGVDLDNDGRVGHFVTSIETAGSNTLSEASQGHYLIDGSIRINLNEADVGPGSIPGWTAVQVEATTGGYRVLWKNANGQFSDWTLDSNGKYDSHTRLTDVRDVEAFYGVDLDNDGRVGHFVTSIETAGSNTLSEASQGQYLIDGSIGISLNGVDVGPQSYAAWQAIHVESDGTGYKVLWQGPGRTYTEWTVDDQGRYLSHRTVGDVIDVENFYQWDIDGSGTVGYAEPKVSQAPGAQQKTVADGVLDLDAETDVISFIPNLGEHLPELEFDDPGIVEATELASNSLKAWDGVPDYESLTLEHSEPSTVLEDDVFLL